MADFANAPSVMEDVVRYVRAWLALAAVAPLVLSGCKGLMTAPTYPGGAPRDQGFDEVSTGGMEGLEQDEPQPLRLYPGDVIAVQTISEETTNVPNLLVDETGNVHLPLGGDVDVGGLTLGEAADRIERAMRAYVKFARVTVTLAKADGHRATVLGAVANPGEVKLRPGMRLADLLAAVGGPLRQMGSGGGQGTGGQATGGQATGGQATGGQTLADLAGARLRRDGKVVPVSVVKALEGDPHHNVRIRPGDHLYVPPRIRDEVIVLGAVNGASAVSFRPGMRLTEALALAGGPTGGADNGDIRIVRGGLEDPRVYVASLTDVVDGTGKDVMLQHGDVIYVTDHWVTSTGDVLDALGPILSTAVTIGLTATTAVILSRP